MKSLLLTIALSIFALMPQKLWAQKDLFNFLDGLSVEKPLAYKNLTIYPLSTLCFDRTFDILTLDQASEKGLLRITELGSGQVNRILVENRSRSYVFLMAGELVAGCKQDRMVAEDCLLPPMSGKVEISVYCTEHGRWTENSHNFHSLKASAHLRMRQVAQETKSQQEVWDAVREKSACLSVPLAATEDLKSVIGHGEVEKKVKPYQDKLAAIPRLGKNVVGVAVAYEDEVICIDILANPSLFGALWPKLLKSYVLDVIDRPDVKCSVTSDEVEHLLASVSTADFERDRTDGVGQAWSFRSSRLSGSSLLFRSRVIHCDIFLKRDEIKRSEDAPRLDYRRKRNIEQERR